MECTHKKMTRLYERSNNWKSTNLYKCEDCNTILIKGFEEIKPKKIGKSIRELTKDALQKHGE